jgi:enamine deaminase RidA (YjgF/YER057c/UK114 family)
MKKGWMMTRKHVSSGSPYERSTGFSRAVRVGDRITVAGTAPIASDGSAAWPGDVYRQTIHCIEIIKGAIEEAGGILEDVVRTRIMMTDVTRWEEAARAHGEYFSSIRPACTIVEISRLIDEEWLVEIEADCIVGNR